MASRARRQRSAGFRHPDYELVEKPSVAGFSFRFCQTRWFEFYRYLKARSSRRWLGKQLKLFMEENHMSIGNQLSSCHLLALENFLTTKALMDETLNVVRFRSNTQAVAQLRKERRYVRLVNVAGVELLIGYWLVFGEA